MVVWYVYVVFVCCLLVVGDDMLVGCMMNVMLVDVVLVVVGMLIVGVMVVVWC